MTLETKRHQKKKHRAVLELGGHCLDCGGEFPDCAYDFHHLDPETKPKEKYRQLNFTRTWDKIKIELDKCVLLCANCHRIRHHTKDK